VIGGTSGGDIAEKQNSQLPIAVHILRFFLLI
jgi:hypothetical protein